MPQVRLDPPSELAMPVGEAMFTQRAIRRLRSDPIGEDQVKIILDAASKAPSGGNVQPARHLVIRDPEKIRAFGGLYREAWWAKRRDTVGWKTVEDIPPEEAGYLAAARLADEIRDAPLVILVFGTIENFGHSIFPAVQNLLLAARALGIGTTLTTLHEDVMERLYAMFKIPERAHFYCCIPMGYPRGRFGLTPRRPSAETTYWDEWDAPPPWA